MIPRQNVTAYEGTDTALDFAVTVDGEPLDPALFVGASWVVSTDADERLLVKEAALDEGHATVTLAGGDLGPGTYYHELVLENVGGSRLVAARGLLRMLTRAEEA